MTNMNTLQSYDNILDSVAVIGMAGRFPGAKTIDKFWQNLCNGVESVSFFTDKALAASGVEAYLLNNPRYVKAKGILEDIESFDAFFFGFNPKEVQMMDVQHRIFLECAWEAIENAGYTAENYKGLIGVYAGSGMNTYFLNNIYPTQGHMETAASYQLLITNDKDALATLTAYKLNLKGPCVVVQTACSTSLVAVHLACQSLISGECDMALAGGVSVHVPQKSGYLYEEGMILSPDGHCRAFDANAQGTVSGNGCGIVVLKRLEDAVADKDCIHAIIRGSSVNNDGSVKVGYTAPGVEGQRDVIMSAQAIAGISPETITYIEAHGTGTSLGDPIEIDALTQAFRAGTQKKNFCAIGSVKSNIGHLNTAAGVTGLIKTVLALKHKIIPPSLNFEHPNPKIDFANSPFYVNTKLSEWKTDTIPRRAGVSSFGIGGTNAHVVLEEAPYSHKSQITNHKTSWQLLTLSAKTATALDTAAENLVEYLKQHPENLKEVAYTLQTGRKTFNYRRIMISRYADETGQLETKRFLSNTRIPYEPKVVFMFSGQGSQYVNMGKELYETEPIFREHIDQCSEILKNQIPHDLRHILYPDENESEKTDVLNQTAITQPALFVIEYALAKLWMTWGIQPHAMIGHSIGEYVAACIAGVFSLEDALSLVADRGKMMQTMPQGAMLAILLSEKDVQPYLNKGCSLAAVNGVSFSVISGATEAITDLENQLAQNNIEYRRLHTSHAFHSEMMESIVKPFASRISNIRLKAPQIPFISNVTGKWITPEHATDPGYWAKHLRHTVRFADGLGELLKASEHILLEVGPGRTLTTFATQHPAKTAKHLVLNSMRHPKENESDTTILLTALGRLWLTGVKVNWLNVHHNVPIYRVPLPTYPFERKQCWIKAGSRKQKTGFPASENLSSEFQISKKTDIADWFYIPSWKRSTFSTQHSALSTHIPPSDAWLLFLDECGLGLQLAKQLKQKGHDVITVKAGTEFSKTKPEEYTLNPEQDSHYDMLINEIYTSDKTLKQIVHLQSVTNIQPFPDNRLEMRENAQLYSLLFLTQSIGKQGITDDLQITVVSNGIQAVTGEEWLCPEKATLLGPVKIIPLEYPNIRCRSIDVIFTQENLSRSESRQEKLTEQLANQLLTAIISESSAPITALRGKYQWIQTFEPIRIESREQPSILRTNGVYLITGGLGGMGLVLAEHLAKTVKAKLILTGRTAFPERHTWEQWIEIHEKQDKICQRILKLKAMEDYGSEILIFIADVANHDQMKDIIEQGQKQFGQINGVIHTAGIADYAGVIQKRTKEMTEQILLPKVKGTLVLDNILKDVKLDFFMLCSSLSNILYKTNFGQVGYNAANEFLDAFAYYKTIRDNTFTISVNWNNWQEVGMSVQALKQWTDKLNTRQADKKINDFMKGGLLPSEGIEVFNRIIETDLPGIAVSAQDLTLLMEQDASPFSEDSDISDPAAPLHERPELSSDYAAPTNETEKNLAHIWQELLGIVQVGIHDNFFELGGQSLSAVRVVGRIYEESGIEIAPAEFYNYPTIKELAEQISLKSSHLKKTTETFTPLVRIQPNGEKIPVFFIHAAEGNVYCYIELSRQLGMNQPFYGLKAYGTEPGTSPLSNVTDMAEKYLEIIKTVQPDGPYILGGHCFGGVIAYEIGRQLRLSKKQVPLIILIDSFAPHVFSLFMKDDIIMDFITFSQTLAGPSNIDLLPFYCNIRGINPTEGIQGIYKDIQQLPYEQRLDTVIKSTQNAGLRLDIDTEYLDRAFKVYREGCCAFRNYKITDAYNGTAVFFRAADDPNQQTDDLTLGWADYIPSLKAYDIPGNHFTILTPPNVQLLAKHIRHWLERSDIN